MSNRLLATLGLKAPQQSTPADPERQTGQASADPVSTQHDGIARLISAIADPRQQKELERRLAVLRSTHEAGRRLGHRGKQMVLQTAELGAAARLYAQAKAIAGAASAAPAEVRVSGPGNPAAAAASGPKADATGELPPELVDACDKFLRAHRFNATSAEVVSGDMQCDVWLDGHLVTQEGVRAALLAALPGLARYPIPLARLVAEHWALEVRQALVFSGRMPRQAPAIVSKPEGVLARAIDGQEFWQPAPIATMAGSEPVVDAGWLKDFFEFYGLAPGKDGAAAGACRFNEADDTLDGAVRQAGEQATRAGYKANPAASTSSARSILDRREKARRQGAAIIAQAKAAGRATQPAKEPNVGWQVVPAVAAQYAGHWLLTPLPSKPADPNWDGVYQFQFGLNNVRHPENAKGKEFQGQLVIGYNSRAEKDPWQVLAGAQFADVLAVWKKVQAQFFASIQGGATIDKGSVSGGVFQAQTGVQFAVTLGSAQIGIQVGVGTTITKNAPTGDFSPATFLAQFPLPIEPKATPKAPAEPELDIGPLRDLPMPDLLDALEAIRDAGQLDKLDKVPNRIRIARLAVEGKTDDAMTSIGQAGKAELSEDDRDALRKVLYRDIVRLSSPRP